MSNYVNTSAYIRTLWDSVRSNMEIEMAAKGYEDISPSHGWIFHHTGPEGSRITELAAIAHITKQSMSTLVAQLVSAGYAVKKPDPADSRAWVIQLTAKGLKAKEAGQAINRAFEERWRAQLGKSDYEQLRSLLAKLAQEEI